MLMRVGCFLNEVLSITAQELGFIGSPVNIRRFLNEVLSITAQELPYRRAKSLLLSLPQ